MKSIVETLVTFIILISISVSVAAQNKLGTWKSYSSYNSVTHIVTDRNNHDWISTQGGLFEVQDNDILQSLSTLDGLYSNLIRALTYDSISHGLWIGYIDGTLEFFDIENVLALWNL